MPSLTKKIVRGKPYYYLRECQRVNGKPKIVSTTYLGSPESIRERLLRPPRSHDHRLAIYSQKSAPQVRLHTKPNYAVRELVDGPRTASLTSPTNAYTRQVYLTRVKCSHDFHPDRRFGLPCLQTAAFA